MKLRAIFIFLFCLISCFSATTFADNLLAGGCDNSLPCGSTSGRPCLSNISKQTPCWKESCPNWWQQLLPCWGSKCYICPQTMKLSYFYYTVNQNSPISEADNHICINNILSMSGKVSMDLRVYDHYGDGVVFNPDGTVLFNDNQWGVGIRPMFGKKQTQWWASLNQASLFIDAWVNRWILADLSLVYANSSVKGRTFASNQSDYRSVYGSPAALKVDEAYLTIARPDVLPIYARIGKQYSFFGQYRPYPITESLTQLLEQSRTGAAVLGFVLPCGLYGLVNWSLSKQSLQDINGPAGNELASMGSEPHLLDRNYGAKLGYQISTCLFNQPFHFNANGSWIYDIRDADYINEIWFQADAAASNAQTAIVLAGQEAFFQHAGGAAFHADTRFGPFGATYDYVTALDNLNPVVPHNSKIRAWAVAGNVNFVIPFKFFGCCGLPTMLEASYQGAAEARIADAVVFNDAAFAVAQFIFDGLVPFHVGNVLPKRRLQLTGTFNVLKNTAVTAQWVHDTDFPRKVEGAHLLATGLKSNIWIANFTVQL